MGWASTKQMALPLSSTSVDSGHARLNELGYKQELKRDLSYIFILLSSFYVILILFASEMWLWIGLQGVIEFCIFVFDNIGYYWDNYTV